MFIDITGALGTEHNQDLRREAVAYRAAHVDHPAIGALREFLARGYLGPFDNYRSR